MRFFTRTTAAARISADRIVVLVDVKLRRDRNVASDLSRGSVTVLVVILRIVSTIITLEGITGLILNSKRCGKELI